MPEQKLPVEMEELLKSGDITKLQDIFLKCEPNAVSWSHSNVFSLLPMSREFAFWAKERGADINFRDHQGRTPLFEVARRDGDIPLLIELGADVNATAKDGYTPLHIAALRGRKKAVRALLKAGADIDARTEEHEGYGSFTPLEWVICESSLSCTMKYEMCKLLLDRGAARTERSRRFASAFSEAFYRHNSGKKFTKSLLNQAEALEKLCGLFDAEMIREVPFHDGASPILVTNVGGGYKEIFQELWNFLVPPSGRAQTAQGEIIRIAGRIEDELMRNGGMNWDEDYRKMLDTFRKYLYLDVSQPPDEFVEEIIEALWDGDVNDGMIWRLCYCAQHWVENNPEVRPPLQTDYMR